MATRIAVLDENVINRIAAGEVVERPVSVVKELVENSIDAEASSLELDIENGGKKLIRIRDNGTGMSHDDAFLALERHATSKLRSEKDLVGVPTLGFRGEALASIASVSKLRLMTYDGIEDSGAVIVVEGGVLRKSERTGMARGTVVEVANLFYNTPVRRKFLKGPSVEAGHIQEMITRFALAHPTVGIHYREDGRIKLDAPAVRSTLERVHTLYSRDVRENLMQVERSLDDIRVHGFVARPPYARSNMRSVLTFVNGRSVRDRLINSAVSKAFANLIERGRYPLATLFLELPPDQVDVNVHPQKAEVRFVNPQLVFSVIVDGVYEALTGAPFTPPPGPKEPILPKPPTTPVLQHVKDEREREQLAPIATAGGQISSPVPSLSLPALAPAPMQEPESRFSTLGVLGSLPGSFLILHSDDELIVMDHHAAHERVLFEELKAVDDSGVGFECQDLLIPRVLEYPPVEARALAQHLELLERVGFRIEEFGQNDFVVKGVPSWIGDTDLERFFGSLIDVMLDTGLRGDPRRFREELLKSMACHAAVKGSKTLQPEEVRALLRDLDRLGAMEVCPHGRPFLIKIPFAEISKKMGRR
ncbi:MAG: DNA mismatch repair endonuclease MutL [Deltaproteobacteria bacterium]|nr:DNA mismatch repair endonuclease MutL [Deltaproteobacteria bacterium]